jgi:16S rRNA (cytosine967-C5)-methyltransferase
MKKTARTQAVLVFNEIEEKSLYANIHVPRFLRSLKMSDGDNSRVTDLVMGTYRWKIFLDAIIEVASGRPLEKIQADLIPILRIGAYELLFGKTTKEILVSEWVNEAFGLCGSQVKGFSNAILRRVSERDFSQWQREISEEFANREDILWSHPEWIIKEFKKLILEESELYELLKVNNSPPVNWKVCKNKVTNPSALAPIAQSTKASDLSKLASGINSNIRIQDAASQAAAYLFARFDVKENETDWLDVCAAPGGKTATMAQERPNTGIKISAFDLHPHKKELMDSNLKGFTNVDVQIADSRLKPWGSLKFDRILLDAPCTGLGAIRRRAESRWKKAPTQIKELTGNAKEIFDVSVQSLKPGGYIEYVVCSPILEETDDFVFWALKNYPNLTLINPKEYLAIFDNEKSDEFVTTCENGLRFWPHRHQTDAMFICLFQMNP